METVLFDCWGTLLRAPNLMRRGASAEFFHRSLIARGHEIDFDAFRDAYIAVARRQHEEARSDLRELDYVSRIDSTLHEIGFRHPDRARLARKVWAEYLAEWPRQSELHEEAPSLLRSLRGRYKLGLVTNFPDAPTAREAFRRFGFNEAFDSLVVSAEVGYRKPNRVIFERALMELGSAPASSVMVGDTFEADIRGAKSLGMKAILIDADGG
ncbi:MAG: HAD family hydrolase, partial [Candidatus Bathyarchaeia archaeon]